MSYYLCFTLRHVSVMTARQYLFSVLYLCLLCTKFGVKDKYACVQVFYLIISIYMCVCMCVAKVMHTRAFWVLVNMSNCVTLVIQTSDGHT